MAKKILVLLLSAGILWIFYNAGKVSLQKYRLQSKINNLKAQIQFVEKRNQDLHRILSSLKNPAFLEKEARQKLNLKKPGEKVVVIVPKSSSRKTEENSSITKLLSKMGIKPPELSKSNLEKWREFFFGSSKKPSRSNSEAE